MFGRATRVKTVGSLALFAMCVALLATAISACGQGNDGESAGGTTAATDPAPANKAPALPEKAVPAAETPPAAEQPAAGAADAPASSTIPDGVKVQPPPDMPEKAAADAAPSKGGVLFIGAYTDGVFAAGLPTETDSNRPYIDYTISVRRPGVHQIDLLSTDTAVYDPYIRLLREDSAIAHDDDGGEDLQSQLVFTLAEGTHKVRVTSFGTDQPSAPASYRLYVRKID